MKISYDPSKLTAICKRNDISYLAMFGSQARGDARDDSDVDLLVRFNSHTKSVFDRLDAKYELEDLFQHKVDLVPERALSKYLRPYVVKDTRILYSL